MVRAIHRAGSNAPPRAIPVLSVFMSKQAAPRVIDAGGVRDPDYPFPEEAARALSLVARYGAWRLHPKRRSQRSRASMEIWPLGSARTVAKSALAARPAGGGAGDLGGLLAASSGFLRRIPRRSLRHRSRDCGPPSGWGTRSP